MRDRDAAVLALMLIFATFLPAAVWMVSVEGVSTYFTSNMPPGQLAYVLSKLAGLVAISFFWLQWMLAFLRWQSVASVKIPLSFDVHRALGVVVLVLVLAHALLFFLAVSQRTEEVAWHVLLPSFSGGYYKSRVSLGILALVIFPVAVLAGVLRHRFPVWRWMHRAWVGVFALVVIHALAIGTESRFDAMWLFLMFMIVTLGSCSCFWLVVETQRHWIGRRQGSCVTTELGAGE